MKYGKKIDIRFRYKMEGREPVEKQVYRHEGCDVIYDEVLGRMYVGTKYDNRIDHSNYSRVSVGLLFDLAKSGEADVWQFSAGTLIWMAQGGRVTNMYDLGVVD